MSRHATEIRSSRPSHRAHSLGRIGVPAMCGPVQFLLSASDFVTGQVLYVDGGKRMSVNE